MGTTRGRRRAVYLGPAAGTDEHRTCRRSRAPRVRIAAGPRFGVGGSLERFVRVPFTQHDDQLLRGVELLAQAWHTVTGALPLADSTMVG